jgi:hypothetical protein
MVTVGAGTHAYVAHFGRTRLSEWPNPQSKAAKNPASVAFRDRQLEEMHGMLKRLRTGMYTQGCNPWGVDFVITQSADGYSLLKNQHESSIPTSTSHVDKIEKFTKSVTNQIKYYEVNGRPYQRGIGPSRAVRAHTEHFPYPMKNWGVSEVYTQQLFDKLGSIEGINGLLSHRHAYNWTSEVRNSSKLKQFSKAMTYHLRHGLVQERDSHQFVPLESLYRVIIEQFGF